MLEFWIIGVVVCFVLCVYVVILQRKYELYNYPLVYDVLGAFLFATLACVLSWIGVVLLLMVLIAIPRND
jgi:hypothetical protein